MAGDWLKLEKSTARKPEVLRMAAELGLHRRHIVGLCFDFWAWCDDNARNGIVTLTSQMLDAVVEQIGFSTALINVGWLVDNGGELSIPNFERHMSNAAKSRLDNALRQRKYRNGNVTKKRDTNNKKALPEKRREEKRRDTTPIVPKGTVDAGPFDQFWKAYPRRVGKTAAGKAFARAAIQIAPRPASDIVEAAEAFASTPKAKGEFCPHPATWLNRGSYDDDRADWQKSSSANGKPTTDQPHKPKLPTDEQNQNYSPY